MIIIVCVPSAVVVYILGEVKESIKPSKPGTADEQADFERNEAHSHAVTAGSLDAAEEKGGKPNGLFRWLIW